MTDYYSGTYYTRIIIIFTNLYNKGKNGTVGLTSGVMLAREAFSSFIMTIKGVTKTVARNARAIIRTSGVAFSTQLKTNMLC